MVTSFFGNKGLIYQIKKNCQMVTSIFGNKGLIYQIQKLSNGDKYFGNKKHLQKRKRVFFWFVMPVLWARTRLDSYIRSLRQFNISLCINFIPVYQTTTLLECFWCLALLWITFVNSQLFSLIFTFIIEQFVL